LIVEIFVGLERFVTLFLFADRRILNASLAVSVRSADRGKIADILGDHSCLLSLMLRRCLASMSASELRHTLDGEFQRMNRPTAVLRLISAVAPLAGLLGTVLGTMVAMASTDPKLGISTALVTTAIGIAVALGALVAAHFSEERLARLLDDIEDICRRGF
jgi:biopolymer transport protein ExbB/TolQ